VDVAVHTGAFELPSGAALTRTPATPPPVASVNVPEIRPSGAFDWACNGMLTAKTKDARKATRKKAVFIFSPPLPHAWELKVGLAMENSRRLRTTPVSWLGGTGPWLHRAGARPSRSDAPNSSDSPQWLAQCFFRLTVARRRRLGTVFPCTQFAIIVRGRARCWLRCAGAKRARGVEVNGKTSLTFHFQTKC
jgi:hypothetical protein